MSRSLIDSLNEEIQVLRLMLYRDDALPDDPSCCIHCGPLLRKTVILEQQLEQLRKSFAA